MAEVLQVADFNDLATKSGLGPEGINRQVRPPVHAAAIEKHKQALV